MILLDYHNKIIEEVLLKHLDILRSGETNVPLLDITLADFDGVKFHITASPETSHLVQVSLEWRCAQDLRKNGGDDVVKAVYGKILQAKPEAGYDLTLVVDYSDSNIDNIIPQVALFKRHLLAGPFDRVFTAIEKGTTVNPIWIQYRQDEGFLVKTEGTDRVTVVFSIHFNDPADKVLGRVFLQEFSDARRSLNNVPAVTFSQKDPPMELNGVKGVNSDVHQGFVTFVLFKNHIDAAHREKTINNIQTFRNYLHYHIKCSKAYMHDRMRKRVEGLLQVLNRAKSEPFEPKEKKTITGKTFKPVGAVGKGPIRAGGPAPVPLRR